MRAWSVLFAGILLAACGGERTSQGRHSGCTPGQSVECACAPGVQGVQVCRADFTFEPCVCLGHDAGAGADAGVIAADDAGARADAAPRADAGAQADAGSRDAQPSPDADVDSGVHPDAAALDTGVPPDAGFVDSGAHPDATVPDTGVPPDAGFVDSGVHPDAAVPDSGVQPDAGTTGCTFDTDCPSGRCHPLYNQCVPTNRKLDCETCSSDSECGLAADHCLSVTIGGQPAETICAQGCNQDNDCPRGYECSLSNHCYPIPGAIRVHTCASIRDTLAGVSCDPFLSTDQCGLPNFDDGTCVLGLGCTVGCVSNVQCPASTTCTNWIVGDFCQP